MSRMGLQRGRLLFIATMTVGVLFVTGISHAGPAPGDSLILGDFEAYMSTDEVRADWSILEPELASLDLECGTASDWPVGWCASHSNSGPSVEGNHYLRINYLLGTTIARLLVNGDGDWSGWPYARIWYRGRPWAQNGPADMQITLIGNGGAHVLNSPVVVGATDCVNNASIIFCDWSYFDLDLRGWPGLVDVDEVQIMFSTTEGNGELYIDSLQLRTHSPIPVEPTSWGSIKAMYR
jgi:hypothetical protein